MPQTSQVETPEQKHTPTPWTADGNGIHLMVTPTYGKCVAITYDPDGGGMATKKANAEFIVKACNSHEELVAELFKMTERFVKCLTSSGTTPEYAEIAVTSARIALARATGAQQ